MKDLIFVLQIHKFSWVYPGIAGEVDLDPDPRLKKSTGPDSTLIKTALNFFSSYKSEYSWDIFALF